MAETKQEATVHRSFAYTDKDGKRYFFTRANQHLVTEVMPPEHLEYYQERGMISFSDKVEIPGNDQPTQIPKAASASVAQPAGMRPVANSTRANKES